MKKMIYLLVALMVIGLFGGCAAPEAVRTPVAYAPEWTEAAAAPEIPVPQVRIHMELTKSMMGFSGQEDSSISRTLLELMNEARFNTRWSAYLLEPDQDKDLQWEECNPLLVTAAMINVDDRSSYTITGDFDEGGPVYSLFHRQPDPLGVNVLITDLMEQEGQINALLEYVQQLFRADSHQQLYIAIADSPFSGRVSFPKIVGEEFKIGGCDFEGERPFAVIAAGPRAGVEEVRRVLSGSGVDFKEFLVENRRDANVSVEMEPAQILGQNILIEDMAEAHAIIDLSPMKGINGGFVYDKVSANRARSALLVLHTLVEPDLKLSLGQQGWMRWERLPAPEEQGTAPTEYTERWGWIPCDSPEGVTIVFGTVESGSAIAGQTAERSGLEDITVPGQSVLWELRMYLDEQMEGTAYAFEAELVMPVQNPLASAAPFAQWDISFSLYGRADKDPSILKRIPDLGLLLNALTGLDAAEDSISVGRIRFIIQHYS